MEPFIELDSLAPDFAFHSYITNSKINWHYIYDSFINTRASQWHNGTESTCNTGVTREVGLIPPLGRSPGEGMETHSSILAWKIPWIEEPDRLQSMGSQNVRHDLEHSSSIIFFNKTHENILWVGMG